MKKQEVRKCKYCGETDKSKLVKSKNRPGGGLLCQECNTALGLLHEDKQSIKQMLEYLQ